MGRMRMGHDRRGKQPVSTATVTKVDLTNGEIVGTTESLVERILERHADTFKLLAEAEQAEKPLATMLPSCQCSVPTILEQKVVERIETIKEVSTTDRRARRHSMATRTELHKDLNRKHSLLNRAIEIQREKADKLTSRINVLEQAKPQEKQVVIEKTEITSKTPKLVMAGLALSLALNVLILIIK